MPAYTPYTADEYAPDAPASADHFRRWFQNWEAGAEGADGAPRNLIKSIERISVGDEIRSRIDAEKSGALIVVGHSFGFCQIGSVRVAFEHKANAGYGAANVSRTRGGVKYVLATFANTTAYVARSVDVSVIPGDLLLIENDITGSAYTAFLKNQRFKTNGESLWPGAACILEGNNV